MDATGILCQVCNEIIKSPVCTVISEQSLGTENEKKNKFKNRFFYQLTNLMDVCDISIVNLIYMIVTFIVTTSHGCWLQILLSSLSLVPLPFFFFLG